MAAVETKPLPKEEKKAPAATKAAPPKRPDEAVFKTEQEKLKKEHESARDKVREINLKLDYAKAPGKNPRQQELREQMRELQQQQSVKKTARSKLDEQIKAIETGISTKGSELKASKGKLQHRSVDEIDAAIKKLQARVDTGTMKIVDERKALSDISNLNKQRKNFGEFEKTEKWIAEEKAKLQELNDKRYKDPEQAKLSEEYEKIKKELDGLKEEGDAAFKNIQTLRDERTALKKDQDTKWEALKKLRDDNRAANDAWWEWERNRRTAYRERREKESADRQAAKDQAAADDKIEAASRPAFFDEIKGGESLIVYFDPSSAEATRRAKNEIVPRELAAKEGRKVDASGIKGTVLKKEEEEYFVGGGGKKKGKKGRKNSPATPTPTNETAAEDGEEKKTPAGKLNLNYSIVAQLESLKLAVPTSTEQIPMLLEQLREKVEYFKKNQDRVTQENIAEAKKALESGSSGKKSKSKENGTSTPTATSTSTPATPAEIETEEKGKEEDEVAPVAEQEPSVDAEVEIEAQVEAEAETVGKKEE